MDSKRLELWTLGVNVYVLWNTGVHFAIVHRQQLLTVQNIQLTVKSVLKEGYKSSLSFLFQYCLLEKAVTHTFTMILNLLGHDKIGSNKTLWERTRMSELFPPSIWSNEVCTVCHLWGELLCRILNLLSDLICSYNGADVPTFFNLSTMF